MIDKLSWLVICLLGITSLTGCHKQDELIDSAPKQVRDTLNREYRSEATRSIEGEVMNNTDVLFNPRYVVKTKHNFVVLNLSGDSLAQVLDSIGMNQVGLHAKKGNGPTEFKSVWSYSRAQDTADLWIYDVASQRMHYWESKEYELNPTGFIGQQITFESTNHDGQAMHVSELSNGQFAAVGSYLNTRVQIFDSKGKEADNIGTFPQSDPSETPAITQQKYSSYITSKPFSNTIALAGIYRDDIDIFNLDDNTHISISGPYGIEPRYTVLNDRVLRTKESALAFQSLASSDKYIFALLSGKSPAGQPNEELAFYGQEIWVLDWEGNLIDHLKVDDYLFSISVSTDGTTIYGVKHYPSVEIIAYKYP